MMNIEKLEAASKQLLDAIDNAKLEIETLYAIGELLRGNKGEIEHLEAVGTLIFSAANAIDDHIAGVNFAREAMNETLEEAAIKSTSRGFGPSLKILKTRKEGGQ